MLNQIETHPVLFGQLFPLVRFVDAKLAHDPPFGSGDHRGGADGPVHAAAAERTDAGIVSEEPFLVLYAFVEGELVPVAIPDKLKGGVFRKRIGESGQQVVENAVFAGQVRLLVILRYRVIGIAFQDFRNIDNVGIQEPVMEVGLIVFLLERQQVLQVVQLG